MAVYALFLAFAVAEHLQRAEPLQPSLGAAAAPHAPAPSGPPVPAAAATALEVPPQHAEEAQNVPKSMRIPGVGPSGEVPVLSNSHQPSAQRSVSMLRAAITEPIAMNKLRSLDGQHVTQWRKPMTFTGKGGRPKAFMVSPAPLYDAKAPILWELGFEPVRVPPVHTELSCIGNLASRTGTFLAHRAAWAKIAETGAKGLVLEADWSIGDMSAVNAEKLAKMLDELRKRPDDLTKVGSCGSLCNTAYYMGPEIATLLQNEDPCLHPHGTDVFTRQLCYQQVKLSNGRYATCHIVTGGTVYARSQGLYGSGLIFQDRTRIRGLHDSENRGRYNASKEDLDTV